MSVFEVRHTQSLSSHGAGPLTESRQLEVVFTKEAITSGFLARLQKRDAGSALSVLMTLVLHTRPLLGEELALLQQHGLATPDDQGRLFCWLTRKGIAEALDTKWDVVERAMKWLIAQALIREVPMPAAFVARFVRTKLRGQLHSEVLYILNVDGMMRTQWAATDDAPSVPSQGGQSDASVPFEGVHSPASIPPEGIHSATSVPLHGRQSLNHDTSSDNDGPAREKMQALEVETAIANAWHAALGTELPLDHVATLAAWVHSGQTNLAVLQALLTLLAARAPGYPAVAHCALLTEILEGRLSPAEWAAPPPAPPPLPDVPPAPSEPEETPAADPVLAQVCTWYEQEVGELTPFAADEIRDLTARYRDLDAWKGAFTKAAPIGREAAHWAYIVACMEGSDGQFKLDRKPKPPPGQAPGGHSRTRTTSAGANAASGQRGRRRAKPPVVQFSAAERARLEAAAEEELPALEASARAALAELGLGFDGLPLPGDADAAE